MSSSGHFFGLLFFGPAKKSDSDPSGSESAAGNGAAYDMLQHRAKVKRDSAFAEMTTVKLTVPSSVFAQLGGSPRHTYKERKTGDVGNATQTFSVADHKFHTHPLAATGKNFPSVPQVMAASAEKVPEAVGT